MAAQGTDILLTMSTEAWIIFSTTLNSVPQFEGLNGHVYHVHASLLPEDPKLAVGIVVLDKETGRFERPFRVKQAGFTQFAGPRGNEFCPVCVQQRTAREAEE